jgi:hypothetical protein
MECTRIGAGLRNLCMKATQKQTEPARVTASSPSQKLGQARPPGRIKSERPLATTVREWARDAVKKSPIDPAEGGSGQP